MLLHERLSERFGSENVFLDVRALQPGMKWLEETKSHRASCNVLLSLIGPNWVSILKEREQAAVAQPAEDYVLAEIEYALKPNSGIWVIPVLVGEVMPPSAGNLRGRCRRWRRSKWYRCGKRVSEDDVAHLISGIEEINSQEPAPASNPAAARRSDVRPPATAPTDPSADETDLGFRC